MTNQSQPNSTQQLYNQAKANLKQIKKISPFWILPFIALCISGVLFFQIVQEQGTSIRITFESGNGLVAGKTQIRYQGLQIGVVKKVSFTPDLKQVEVVANIYPEAKNVLRENTKFWLVKPSASLAGISGIDALVSGNYINLQPGDGESADKFIAETTGPITQLNDGDLLVHLIADDLGSISIGASVYYKKLPVGKISDYRFTDDGQKVEIDLLISKSYAHFVKKQSYFWNISGLNANVGLTGINVNMDSLNALVQGAVAFDSPEQSEPAENNDKFNLYANFQAAERGMAIQLSIPKHLNLYEGQTALYYNNRQIGVLSKLTESDEGTNFKKGTLLVDPNLAHLFNKHSYIVLRNKNLNLSDLANISSLLRGEHLELIAGNGETQKEFTLIKESELLLQQPNTLVLTLTAPKTYGVNEGQGIYYNDVEIGRVIEQNLDIDGVTFKVAISEKYRHLILQDTQFVANSNLSVQVDANGLNINANSPEKWLKGGIRVLTGKQKNSKPNRTYVLYSDLYHAQMGINGDSLTPTLTLNSKTHPDVDEGSLVLYQQYEVGKILAVRPAKKSFEVDVYIYPKHQHLLTETSCFWVESATQIDVSTKGVKIQAKPLGRTLKGAISFENTSNKGDKVLYANELQAKSASQPLIFTAESAVNLSEGMSIRYLGLKIGEVSEISLNAKNHKILAKALIQPEYFGLVAKESSEFNLITPKISNVGVENLDSLLQPYIEVNIGSGKHKTQFALNKADIKEPFRNGLKLTLETPDASNLSEGAPILYRGVTVGKINKLELNSLGDRVLVQISIGTKHQHFVRQNTEFWIASGYNANVSFNGVEIRTGSVDQLLKGGIAFATPDSKVIQPAAKSGQRFLLQLKRPKQAEQWTSGALN